MAWGWLIEDEAGSEPKLQKPDGDSPVELPRLLETERELLCRHVELRLLEVRWLVDASIVRLLEDYTLYRFRPRRRIYMQLAKLQTHRQ